MSCVVRYRLHQLNCLGCKLALCYDAGILKAQWVKENNEGQKRLCRKLKDQIQWAPETKKTFQNLPQHCSFNVHVISCQLHQQTATANKTSTFQMSSYTKCFRKKLQVHVLDLMKNVLPFFKNFFHKIFLIATCVVCIYYIKTTTTGSPI